MSFNSKERPKESGYPPFIEIPDKPLTLNEQLVEAKLKELGCGICSDNDHKVENRLDLLRMVNFGNEQLYKERLNSESGVYSDQKYNEETDIYKKVGIFPLKELKYVFSAILVMGYEDSFGGKPYNSTIKIWCPYHFKRNYHPHRYVPEYPGDADSVEVEIEKTEDGFLYNGKPLIAPIERNYSKLVYELLDIKVD